MFDSLFDSLLDNQFVRSMSTMLDVIMYTIISAIVLVSGYLTFKIIKLIVQIAMIINYVVSIISNVVNLGLRFTKLIDKITKSKQDKT